MKSLSEKPTVHEGTVLTNAVLGPWTEVGEHNVFENVELGAYSYTGPHCILQNTVVDRFSNIAAMVRIGPTMHPLDRPTLHHFTYRRSWYGFAETDDLEFFNERAARKTFVGRDTWIGHGAIIMPGITLGAGAVVGAGSVVTKDIPPYAIAAGVPARVIRMRFDEGTIAGLEKTRWWDWDHETLKERLADLSSDVKTFLARWGQP